MTMSSRGLDRGERLCTDPSKCRDCSADVLWVTWRKSGKRMPIDVMPAKDGTVIVDLDQKQNTLWARKAAKDEPPTRKRYVSHFDTCGGK